MEYNRGVFEEKISFYVMSPQNKTDVEITEYVTNELKKKQFQSLEIVEPNAKQYISHVPNMSLMVADKEYYRAENTGILYDNQVSFCVIDKEHLSVSMECAKEGSKTLLSQECNSLMERTEKNPCVALQFSVKDRNPFAVLRMASEITNTVNTVFSKKNIYMIIQDAEKNNICVAPDEKTDYRLAVLFDNELFANNDMNLSKIERLCKKDAEPKMKKLISSTPPKHQWDELNEYNTIYFKEQSGMSSISTVMYGGNLLKCRVSLSLPLESIGSFCKELESVAGDKMHWHRFNQGGIYNRENSYNWISEFYTNAIDSTVKHEYDVMWKKQPSEIFMETSKEGRDLMKNK